MSKRSSCVIDDVRLTFIPWALQGPVSVVKIVYMVFVSYDLPDLRRGCAIEKNNCSLLQKITQINLAGDVYNFRFLSQKLRRTFTILCNR